MKRNLKLEKQIDATREFPMRVSYPYAGSHLLLVWYTQNQAHHILAANNEPSLLRAWPVVLKKTDGDAKPVSLWRADLVCPPAKIRQANSRAQLNENFRSFIDYIGARISECRYKSLPIPDGFIPCKKYRSRYGEKELPKDDEHHWSCMNCFHGFRAKDSDVLTFYCEKRHLMPVTKPKGAVSVAPEPDPKKKLYVVKEAFGHHSDGANVHEVAKSDLFEGHWDSPKFFFHGEKLEIPETVLAVRAAWDQRHKDDEAKRHRRFEEERSARARAAQKDLEILLGQKSGSFP